MAQLLVRDVDDSVRDALKRRAVRNGRSMEAEVRSILTEAARGEEVNLGRLLLDGFAPLGGVDFEYPSRDEMPREVSFD